MTAVIHHGPPGSYKTFALVQRVLIPALEAGRVIVTNIRGFNDIEKIRLTLGVTIPESAAIYYLEPDIEGFEEMARFFHWVPAGALIAMDEGQRVYPTRDKNFKHLDLQESQIIYDNKGEPLLDIETKKYVTRPLTLENAFDQHRHFNWDIYISTPNISKIHGEIRSVVEWAYRHRNVSGLLPWYKNKWVEFRHDSETSGKSLAHYSGTPKKYKADFRIFDCYQSTATGTAKNSNENISIFRDPKLRVLLVVICVAVGFVVWNGIAAYERVTAKTKSAPKSIAEAVVQVPNVSRGVATGDLRVPVPDKNIVPIVSPLADAKLFLVGAICAGRSSPSCLLFEAQFTDGRVVTLSYDDLRQLGYSISRINSKFIVLQFASTSLFVWDKPMAAVPVVSQVSLKDSFSPI